MQLFSSVVLLRSSSSCFSSIVQNIEKVCTQARITAVHGVTTGAGLPLGTPSYKPTPGHPVTPCDDWEELGVDRDLPCTAGKQALVG